MINYSLPKIIPRDKQHMKGRRLPNFELHLSLKDPRTGVRKNPIIGLRHQIRDMWE